MIENNIRTIVYRQTICMFFVTKIKELTEIPNIGRYQIFVLSVMLYYLPLDMFFNITFGLH